MTWEFAPKIEANLSARSASEQFWDVAVIGAGPAGALAARQLARAGLQVLLVDKRSFPRDKVCGACLSDRCAKVLQSVGLGELLSQEGAVPLHRVCLASGQRGLDIELSGSWALSRNRFDAALVRAAIDCGVRFLPSVTATVTTCSDMRRRSIRLEDHGESYVAQAKVVIAADGLGSPCTTKTNEFRATVRKHSRIGLGATIESTDECFAPGAIYMTATPTGYVGAVRMEGGQLHFAAAVDSSVLQRGENTHQAIGSMLRHPAWWKESLGQPPTWHGTPRLTRIVESPISRRILLIGDAAGYVEPFTGEGIAWALEGAVAVEPFVIRGVQRWDYRIEQEWLQQYQQRIRGRQKWCRALTYVLQHPRLATAALCGFQRLPGLANLVAKQILNR